MSRRTVYLTVGAPASGKSTLARNMAADFRTVIACRDDIRTAQGYPPVGDKHQENIVTKIQHGIIETALLAGCDVVVPDTNITKVFRKRLIKFAHEHGADVRLLILDVPLDELIKRDQRRVEKTVGEDVIRRMYDSLQSQLKDGTLDQTFFPAPVFEKYSPNGGQPAVVVDIDGTIARHVARSPYDYSKVYTDEPIEHVIDLVHALSGQYKVIFVSGRKAECRQDTIRWLTTKAGFESPVLFMRDSGDDRPDYIVKNEIYDREIIPYYNVEFALDDRDQVVRHVRNRGIPVLQVAPGRF